MGPDFLGDSLLVATVDVWWELDYRHLATPQLGRTCDACDLWVDAGPALPLGQVSGVPATGPADELMRPLFFCWMSRMIARDTGSIHTLSLSINHSLT